MLVHVKAIVTDKTTSLNVLSVSLLFYGTYHRCYLGYSDVCSFLPEQI